MNTIYILWLRQLKRYSRSRARIVGSLGQPLLFMFALGFGLGPVFAKAGQGNYLQFLAPGVISMTILFTAVFSGIELIWDKQFGFLKETLVAPVSRSTIMIGRTLGGATVALLQGCIIFVITLLIGFRPESLVMLPLAFMVMGLLAIFFTAMGTGIASLLNDMQAFPLIMNFLVMPLFFLSGSLFPLDNLPVILHVITRLNPLTYGIDALRAALTLQSHFPFLFSSSILLGCCIVMLAIGTWLFSRMEA